MIVLMFAFTLAVGGLIGVVLAKTFLTIDAARTPTAREVRNHRDAIAVCRTLAMTPDALDLRPDAEKVVADYDAAQRKDN